MAELTGSEILAKALKKEGTDNLLFLMGGPMLLAEASCINEGIRPIDVRHEQAAALMGQAYSRLLQRPSVCMAASGPGVINLTTGMANALIDCCPVVAIGGSSPILQFGRQVFQEIDQVAIMRGCVKWADRICSAELLGPTIERAVRIATEPPAGPVLIGIPFECMMEEVGFVDHGKPNEVVRAHEVNDGAIDRALRLIATAKNPVALTEHVGGDPRAFARFIELCELFSIPVMETYRPAFMNFPRSHPLYLHHDAKIVDAADLVLMVDAVTPWYPASKTPKNAKIISITDEYPNSRLPYWGYNVDLALVAPPASTLEKLVNKAKSSEHVAANRRAYEERLASVRDRHDTYFERLKDEARKHATETPIDPRWACHALAEALPENAVISEETTVYRNLIQETIPRGQPQSYFARITGGLGVGLSYALGVKLALPERPVFALIGDGAFHYNAVPSCLGVAEEYGLPIHAVVFNNGRYLSMETSLIKYFPTGAAKQTGVHFGANIAPRPDYQFYGKAHGGYGYRVSEPGQIKPAIESALRHEAERKLTVIDLVLSDFNPR